MVGGPQQVGGATNCSVTTIMRASKECGHAMGLVHEQSRMDRDSYVNYIEANVDKPQRRTSICRVLTRVYTTSPRIMEYGPFSFARDGVSVVPSSRFQPGSLSAPICRNTQPATWTASGDSTPILRHRSRWTPIPSGLQVVVDSTPCTTPCVFSNWTINSQHNLSVPLDGHGQTLQIDAGGQH